jgi:hypothetical protein
MMNAGGRKSNLHLLDNNSKMVPLPPADVELEHDHVALGVKTICPARA